MVKQCSKTTGVVRHQTCLLVPTATSVRVQWLADAKSIIASYIWLCLFMCHAAVSGSKMLYFCTVLAWLSMESPFYCRSPATSSDALFCAIWQQGAMGCCSGFQQAKGYHKYINHSFSSGNTAPDLAAPLMCRQNERCNIVAGARNDKGAEYGMYQLR